MAGRPAGGWWGGRRLRRCGFDVGAARPVVGGGAAGGSAWGPPGWRLVGWLAAVPGGIAGGGPPGWRVAGGWRLRR
ncbi:hypothetical protein UO65_4459 [Actinokineospora spheciospongiae]|uniref:Uncharacterized protein n=1 Tax=Actinokineospora spheciospongiae TaxID=909613 RepID=W7IVC2_9PSEU|nr:hypothetical protein UO65_4459 [Actinokineospora spheciospongiae]